MGRRIVLDTTALIQFERTGGILGVKDGDDLALAPITLAEFYRGVCAAPTEEIRKRRAAFFDELTSGESFRLLHYTPTTAREHGELLAHTRLIGEPRGPYDIIIAAHARETGRQVLSGDNKARFDGLPGVAIAN